jgi:hypothetical protein
VTDSNGQASSTYTLPSLPQTVTITVTSPGYGSATFTEQGNVGPVASLSIVSGSKQIGTVGTTLPLPVIIAAKDAVGNAVPNASVSYGRQCGIFLPICVTPRTAAQATYTLPTVASLQRHRFGGIHNL